MIETRYSYYLILVPPAAAARLIDRLRVLYGLDRQIVERERRHLTVGKLAVEHPVPLPDMADHVEQAFAGRTFPGCEIVLDRLSGGRLEPSDRLSGLHHLHGLLAGALASKGLGLPPSYDAQLRLIAGRWHCAAHSLVRDGGCPDRKPAWSAYSQAAAEMELVPKRNRTCSPTA